MNQELQTKLLEYLNNGEMFIREQAPDFVKQAMAFYAWEAGFDFYFSLIVFCAMIATVIFLFRLSWKTSSEGAFISAIFLALLSLFPLISTGCSYTSIKKIELAPKLYLVNKLTESHCK